MAVITGQMRIDDMADVFVDVKSITIEQAKIIGHVKLYNVHTIFRVSEFGRVMDSYSISDHLIEDGLNVALINNETNIYTVFVVTNVEYVE